MKHTDTPWYGMVDGKFQQSEWYGQNDEVGSYTSAPIVASDGTTVALVVMEGFHDEELKANAEFIVKAVNSHYPLIEALEGLINQMCTTRGTPAYDAIQVAERVLRVARSTETTKEESNG